MAKDDLGSYEQIGSVSSGVIWPWRMATFAVFILMIVLLAYGGLKFGYGPYLTKQVSQIDAELESLTTQIPDQQQEQFISFYSQLVNLQNLLKGHVISSAVFPFLEKNTNSKVYFSSFDLNVNERRISVDGVAPSYEVLVQQLETLKNIPEVEKYNIADSQAAEGIVRFRLLIYLNRQFFQPSSSNS